MPTALPDPDVWTFGGLLLLLAGLWAFYHGANLLRSKPRMELCGPCGGTGWGFGGPGRCARCKGTGEVEVIRL